MNRTPSFTPYPGFSRRAFLKFCANTASLLALPAGSTPILAKALAGAKRLPVVWLSFQACAGCTESLTRSAAPSIERLLFELISLDVHHMLQAAAGAAAEQALESVIGECAGKFLLVVDGSVPTAVNGACSTTAGEANLSLLARCAKAAEAVIAVGTCAAFGGLPAAAPNPTGAMSVDELMDQGRITRRPLVNLPGCPPIPEVMSAVLAYRVALGRFPELDERGRPLAFYGETVHDRCSRRGHYEAGRFAKTFDDAGARAGWCLLELGCKGPLTHNACSTVRWNGVSNPVESGHPCLGCSEPDFWDRSGFYAPITASASRGAAVFNRHCVSCHPAGPTSLKSPPDEVPALLRSGGVKAHRVALDDADMQALLDYLRKPSK